MASGRSARPAHPGMGGCPLRRDGARALTVMVRTVRQEARRTQNVTLPTPTTRPGLAKRSGPGSSARPSRDVDLHNDGAAGLPGRAAREQPVAPAPVHQLLDQLDDEPHARRPLRVTVDE